MKKIVVSEPRELLTPAEVAAMFRVNPKTVTRWAQAGKLTSVRTLGGHRRFVAAEVQALLNGEAAPTYPAPGSAIPGQPGFVVGECEHRVAASEWRAGFRQCERCQISAEVSA